MMTGIDYTHAWGWLTNDWALAHNHADDTLSLVHRDAAAEVLGRGYEVLETAAA